MLVRGHWRSSERRRCRDIQIAPSLSKKRSFRYDGALAIARTHLFRRDQRVVKEGAALPRSVTRALKAMRACPERTLSVKVLSAISGVSPD